MYPSRSDYTNIVALSILWTVASRPVMVHLQCGKRCPRENWCGSCLEEGRGHLHAAAMVASLVDFPTLSSSHTLTRDEGTNNKRSGVGMAPLLSRPEMEDVCYPTMCHMGALRLTRCGLASYPAPRTASSVIYSCWHEWSTPRRLSRLRPAPSAFPAVQPIVGQIDANHELEGQERRSPDPEFN